MVQSNKSDDCQLTVDDLQPGDLVCRVFGEETYNENNNTYSFIVGVNFELPDVEPKQITTLYKTLDNKVRLITEPAMSTKFPGHILRCVPAKR